MLTKMQEIQDLKLQDYTKADIIRYYEMQGYNLPSSSIIAVQLLSASVKERG